MGNTILRVNTIRPINISAENSKSYLAGGIRIPGNFCRIEGSYWLIQRYDLHDMIALSCALIKYNERRKEGENELK